MIRFLHAEPDQQVVKGWEGPGIARDGASAQRQHDQIQGRAPARLALLDDPVPFGGDPIDNRLAGLGTLWPAVAIAGLARLEARVARRLGVADALLNIGASVRRRMRDAVILGVDRRPPSGLLGRIAR
jgi:hypothetical protein